MIHVNAGRRWICWQEIEFPTLAHRGLERETGFEPATSTLARLRSAE